MDVSRYRSQMSVYRNQLATLRGKIETAQFVNDSRQRLLARKSEIEQLVSDTRVYLDTLRLIQSRCIKENDDFKTRRLNLLNVEITDALEKVLPDKKFVVNVRCDFNRKQRVVTTLTDAEGNEFSPKMSNGKLVQYLTTFSGVSCLVKALGIKSLYVDEAFGASSMNNLPIVGDYVKELVDEGIQVVLVSQNPSLYDGVARREICLAPVVGERRSVVTEVKDFD